MRQMRRWISRIQNEGSFLGECFTLGTNSNQPKGQEGKDQVIVDIPVPPESASRGY
jgi:hypothetical protein